VKAHFRRQNGGWTLVGLERLPEKLTADAPAAPATTRR
jgi:hypothetical protein